MSKKSRKQLSDLASRIETYPGTQMLRAYRSCEIANDAFEVSAMQLRRIILGLEDIRRPLIDGLPGERDKLETLFKEVLQRFLHFLGSIHSLVGRTEQVIQLDFVPDDRRAEHRATVNSTFIAEPAARFMHDFREYVRQHPAPAMILVRHTGSLPERIELLINSANMLHWGKWSSAARSYLHRFQFKLPLLRMVDGHEQRTRTFYHRFVQRFRQHYKSDMDTAAALMEELHGPPSCALPFVFFKAGGS